MLKSGDMLTPGRLLFRCSAHTALLPLCSRRLTSTGFGSKAPLLSWSLAGLSPWMEGMMGNWREGEKEQLEYFSFSSPLGTLGSR